MILFSLAVIAVGFLFLTKGADWLVNGATDLAKRANMSDMAIGLTIVAMGTSLPELMVSMLAAINGQGDVSIGNVLGSNIVNILLVLGITGTIGGLLIQKNTIRIEIPISIAMTVALYLLINGFSFSMDAPDLQISRLSSGILFLGFIAFMVYVAKSMKTTHEGTHGEPVVHRPVYISLLYLFGGIIGLAIGGNLVVENSVKLAQMAGISERVIGLTIVAIGTSLPELATSVVAAINKKTDIAIGNVVGSNIFNIGFVLAISGLIQPMQYNAGFNGDLIIVLMASLLLWAFTAFGFQKNMLERWEAILFLILFAGYTGWLMM